MTEPELDVNDRAHWRGKLVTIRAKRFDYASTSIDKWSGKPKIHAEKEWLYCLVGSNREVRERHLTKAPHQNAGTV